MERETEIVQLEQAIAAIEAQRDVLGEAVVRAALAPLREKMDALRGEQSDLIQQRKYVSVLFADIVGSTKMVQGLDPEDIATIMGGALERFKEVIENHGGLVTRFMGDGLKAIFGMPVVREDDAERAVQAGLAMLEVSRQYAQQVEVYWGLSGFDIRVGINTGPVVLGGGVEADKTVMGSAINLGARMESAAPAGGLLISHDTYRLVQGLFDVEAQPPIRVKGKNEPLHTYIVRSFRSRSFRDVRRGIVGMAAPMLGRQWELKQLNTSYDEMSCGKGTRLLSVIGEPGVGKSRLLYEFERCCRNQTETISYFKGRAAEQLTGTPYALLRDVLLEGFDIQGGDSPIIAGGKLLAGITSHLIDQGEMKAHFIGALIGIEFPGSVHLRGVMKDPDQLRQRALFYLQEYFTALQSDNPVIILLDDVQWADSPSLDAVLQIARECRNCRLMVVCTARPEFIEQHKEWDEEIETCQVAHLQIRLRRLGLQDSRSMVNEILKAAESVPDSLRELVVSKADGNPYYIEELIKMLVEDGVLTITADGIWQVNPAAMQELHVPATLTAVLQARLDSLPAREKTTLQGAAVVGRVFWDAALQVVQHEVPTTTDELKSLSERELVLPVGSTVFTGCAEYQFKHDIMRDVTYETVLKSQRQTYHARVGAWLAETAEIHQKIDHYAAVIAHHFQQAGNHAQAADWYIRAGESALARGASEQALIFFQKSMELLPTEEHDLRWRCLQGQVRTMSRLGTAQTGLVQSEAMESLALEMGDDYKLADALERQVYFLGVLGHHHLEFETIDRALATARKADNKQAEILVLGLKVVSLSNSGDLQAARTAAEEALAFAHSMGNDEMLALTLINVSVYYATAGDLVQAVRLINQQVEIARQLGDLRSEAYNLENLGYQYIMMGMPERGMQALEQVERLAADLGDRRLSSYNQLNLGLAYLRTGDYQQAETVLENAIDSVEGKEEVFSQGTGYTYLAMALEKRGEIDRAAVCFQAATELLEEVGARGYLCDARAGLARCKAAQKQTESALFLARQVWDFLEENGSSGLEFPILACLTCTEIFANSGVDTAAPALERGYQDLMDRVAKISDFEWQQVYLQNIFEHKTILEMRRNSP